MCIVLIGWKAHQDYPLVVAANRDEAHNRASAYAHFWDELPQIYAGRDLEGGGTWLGVTRTGRFAAVTNYRDPSLYQENKHSRGQLVKEFLAGCESSMEYALRIQKCANLYNPFNLLICDAENLVWIGHVPNLPCQIMRLPPGIHGVSNHLINTPWPKIVSAKERFQASLSDLPDHAPLVKLLQVREYNENKILVDCDLDSGINDLMSSTFIVSENYGTRSSTILTASMNGQIYFEEVNYDPSGTEICRTEVKLC